MSAERQIQKSREGYNLDIKWGTPTPIQIQDPKYGIFAPVRSNGAFGIRIADSKKFLIKLVTTMSSFDAASITKYFRSLYVTKVKDAISTYLVSEKISILEINVYLDELSQYMKEQIQPVMEEYGIELVTFYVNEISVPEDDTAVKKLKDALSKKAEMDIIGYSYQQERSFDTLEGAARNPGSASAPFMGAGIGLGMGVGIGQGVGTGFGNIAQKPESNKGQTLICSAFGSEITKDTNFCPECGRKIIHCPNCGNDIADNAEKCSICGYTKPEHCPNCGAEIPAKSKFCPECGQSLARFCPNCNTPIDGKKKFCPECGQKL